MQTHSLNDNVTRRLLACLVLLCSGSYYALVIMNSLALETVSSLEDKESIEGVINSHFDMLVLNLKFHVVLKLCKRGTNANVT